MTTRFSDGRNRYRACLAAGVAPKFHEFTGSEDEALAYVISLNINRRHLNESQRAMAAAKIATLTLGANQHQEGAQIQAPSQSNAATMLNVGRSSVQAARKVIDRGTDELKHAVESGKIAVSAAAKQIEPKPKCKEIATPDAKINAAVSKCVSFAADAERELQGMVSDVAIDENLNGRCLSTTFSTALKSTSG